MKDINEFVEQLVKIEYHEEIESFGHYPFQLFTESQDGSQEYASMLGEGSVTNRYAIFREKLIYNPKKVYMSLDFPAKNDIKSDHVIVFSYENGEFGRFAIPYNSLDGEILPTITESEQLDKVFDNFKFFVTKNTFKLC